MGRASSILIGLFPGRIEVATRSGKSISSFQSRVVDCNWDEAWKLGLSPFDAPLRELIEQVNCRGAAATIVYDSADATADVASFPMNAQEALVAAELAFNSDQAVRRIGVFRAVWETVAPAVKTDVLTAADRVDTAELVVAWAKRAGCRVNGLVPAVAAELAQATELLAQQPADGRTCVLYVGENRSSLVGRDHGQLVFARSIDSGYRLFAESITSATRQEGVAWSLSRSIQWVQANGVPIRGGNIPEGVSIERISPLIFPVLQRYVVETKQTLRFGFGTDALAATLVVASTAGPFQGLARMLGEQLNMQAIDAGEAPATIAGVSCHAALGGPLLLPPGEILTQRRVTLNRMIAAGVGAALLLVAGEAAWTRAARDKVEDVLVAQESSINSMTQTIEATQAAAMLAHEVDSLAAGVAIADSGKVDYLALLGEISRVTPSAIRLAEIGVGRVRDETEITLRGTAAIAEGQADALTPFLDALRGSPVIVSVELGSTRLNEEGGRRVKDFSLTARVRTAKLARLEPQP